MSNAQQRLVVPLPVAEHEALAEWAAEIGVPVDELAARLISRYLRPPITPRDAVDDRIGRTLLARMGLHGHVAPNASTDLRAAFDERRRPDDNGPRDA